MPNTGQTEKRLKERELKAGKTEVNMHVLHIHFQTVVLKSTPVLNPAGWAELKLSQPVKRGQYESWCIRRIQNKLLIE